MLWRKFGKDVFGDDDVDEILDVLVKKVYDAAIFSTS